VERDAKYAAVAAFVLLGIAAAVAFVWWYSGRGDRRDYARYEIYFDGSVSGLSRGSPVRYLGVDVGRVESLTVDRENPSRVAVLADIDSQAPLSGATRARLGLLGLTGLLYIDLQQDPKVNPAQPLAPGRRHPVIPAIKGDIEAVVDQLPELLGRVVQVVQRLEDVLGDDNLAAVAATLKNIESASADLPTVTSEAATLATELRATSGEAARLVRSLGAIADRSGPEIQASLASARAAAEKLGRTADSLERIVVGNEASLAEFAGTGVAELQQLVVDLRAASDEVRELARSLRESPSSLLLEDEESGMEIPP
jgi:phospholipid/cholesterol/gamma-HCH transport system substrate-binding protein